MNELIGEFLGTAMLVLLGNGVVAGVVLNKTKNNNAGWIVITIGWAMAVTMSVFTFGKLTPGAHFNPAVTIAMAVAGNTPWSSVIPYIIAQFLGAFLGQLIVWQMYKPHYDATEDTGAVLGTFATGPALYDKASNYISEIVGTFVLVFTILSFGLQELAAGLTPLLVGGLVLAIGLSLGGTTGYAINPARDLGPRIVHHFLPLKHKGDSDWGYALVPVLGPIIGAVLAAVLHGLIF
ncbi:aquaporin family protein [Streptococcus ovuberis]|uniref:Aquaporin family protein n=2 Tax=Streptococcus TaxID=1301 RepID=A0A7X6MYW5_9STRE|nr:aquaporin family protein [Streptococcus ovuberis]